MRTCPICDKPIFYAPYAPEDTAKMACSDLHCINTHGIVSWLPPSFRGRMCPMTHEPSCKTRTDCSFHRGIPLPSTECTCQVDKTITEPVD